jgi:hypothetical protein
LILVSSIPGPSHRFEDRLERKVHGVHGQPAPPVLHDDSEAPPRPASVPSPPLLQ